MRTIASLMLLLLATACGPNHGTELSKDSSSGKVSVYYTEAVDAELTNRVYAAMTAANYHFGENLDVQLDKVGGRLTLRTCHDNADTIAEILKEGEENGAVSYTHGLALSISKAINNQEVDIVMCRKVLTDPFYTVKWQAPK